jgi:adenosylhomocysteinase
MLKDPALAPAGRRKIDFAASRMPVLAAVTEELARTRPLAGHRIAACLHVTTETANLAGPYRQVAGVLASEPTLVMDDGADLRPPSTAAAGTCWAASSVAPR